MKENMEQISELVQALKSNVWFVGYLQFFLKKKISREISQGQRAHLWDKIWKA